MKRSIVWLRQDLRLTDNPALHHAAQESDVVIPVYLHAPDEATPWVPGAARDWWRHHSLTALQQSLRLRDSRLIIRRGPSLAALRKVIRESGATAIYWNKVYEPRLAQRDLLIADALKQIGLEVHEYHGALLYPPGNILNKGGKPFRIFTAFWRACHSRGLGGPPLPAPQRLGECKLKSEPLEALELLPRISWDHGLASTWPPGEQAALQQLQRFRDEVLEDYTQTRDYPGHPGTSRLSPYLAGGEISPRQVTNAVLNVSAPGNSVDTFISELGWREFAYHCLHHFPHLSDAPLRPRFEQFPWRRDEKLLHAWQQGNTGIPIVDAGMRELRQSGWMHNRVRMITASFLTKNGLQPWQNGARWFWDTLVDADLASNSFNWQWVAGCGLDAAPYFRIFNPLRQSERFDPNGDYLRRWLPELTQLPGRWLHAPWQTPGEVQARCGVRIGSDYPAPILDLNNSRKRALLLFRRLPSTARD